MSGRTRSARLSRFLFCLTCLIATALLLAVGLSPLLDNPGSAGAGWSRLLALFAGDVVVRRTVVASAIGLYVTAGAFFRPAEKPRSVAGRPTRLPPPPANVVGA
jgi:hypothetical protein